MPTSGGDILSKKDLTKKANPMPLCYVYTKQLSRRNDRVVELYVTQLCTRVERTFSLCFARAKRFASLCE
jgi:hypothetical protein